MAHYRPGIKRREKIPAMLRKSFSKHSGAVVFAAFAIASCVAFGLVVHVAGDPPYTRDQVGQIHDAVLQMAAGTDFTNETRTRDLLAGIRSFGAVEDVRLEKTGRRFWVKYQGIEWYEPVPPTADISGEASKGKSAVPLPEFPPLSEEEKSNPAVLRQRIRDLSALFERIGTPPEHLVRHSQQTWECLRRFPEEETEMHEEMRNSRNMGEKFKKYRLYIPEPLYNGADIRKGTLILYGRYIAPPYRVQLVDYRLLVNGIPVSPKIGGPGSIKVPEETRRRHQACLLIAAMGGKTDFSDEKAVEALINRIRQIDVVEDVRAGVGKSRRLQLKFKGKRYWESMGWCEAGIGLSKSEQKEMARKRLRDLRNMFEGHLRIGDSVLWLTSSPECRIVASSEAASLTERINEALRKPAPEPDRRAREYADELDKLKALLPRLSHAELMQIIANWERK